MTRTLLALAVPLLFAAGCRRETVDADPELCGDDVYAPNSIRGEAHPIEANAFDDTGTWSATGLPLCKGDEDWFAVSASAGQRVAIALTFLQEDGDLELDLVSEQGTVLASSQSITDNEYIDWAVVEDGTYYIRIYGAEPGTENDYDLTVRLIGEACARDALEPNDVSLNAVPIGIGVQTDLTVCFGEEDWYEIPAADGQVVVASANFDRLQDDLTLRLFRESANGSLVWLANGTESETGVQVVRQVSGVGPFLLQVARGPDTLTGRYDLDVEILGDACVVDAFEPNDGYLDATPVGDGEVATGLSICVGDHDWYEVDLANGELLEVSVAFDHDEVDLGLQVYKLNDDDTLTYRAGSNTLSDDETVRYRPFDSGTFLVHVWPTRGTVTGTYDLTVDISGTACVDDDFEPNNAYPEARPIEPGQYGSMTLCVGDDDWYEVDIANGQLFRATIGFTHEDNDLGIWLYKLNSDGTLTYRAGSNTLSDNETISYRPFDGGTHVFRVARTRGTVVASYTLDLSISGDACVDDPFEPNNAYPEAQPIAPGVYTGHTLCIGDADWYEIEAENGQVIQLDATFDHDLNDLGMALFKLNDDGSISYRSGSNTLSDNEAIRYRAFESGTFLVYVYRTRGTQLATYDLSIDVVGDACVDDPFEPNDQWVQAVPVPEQPVSDITLCVGDTDWYSLDLVNGQVLDARITFDHEASDLGFRLYQLNEDGTVTYRSGSDSLSDDERILYTPFVSGSYLLQVYRSRGTAVATYGLDVEVRGSGCVPDAFEPNDAYGQARPIAPGLYEGQTLCVGDQDWFTFEASNGQLIEVDLSFLHADNDLGMRLYKLDDDGILQGRAGADTLSDNEFIVYRPFETGTFVLQVYRSRGTVVADYDLDLRITGEPCPDDVYEPNDHWLQAPAIAPGTYTGLGVCVGDQDYYDIGTLGVGDVVTATAVFSHTVGDLGLRVFRYNADGTITVVVTADSVNDDEIAIYTVPDDPNYAGKRYGVHVYRSRGAQVGFYDLDVQVVPGVD